MTGWLQWALQWAAKESFVAHAATVLNVQSKALAHKPVLDRPIELYYVDCFNSLAPFHTWSKVGDRSVLNVLPLSELIAYARIRNAHDVDAFVRVINAMDLIYVRHHNT